MYSFRPAKYLLLCTLILSSFWSVSAQETRDATVERITAKIEASIYIKWEVYRSKYIMALEKLKWRYMTKPWVQDIIDSVILRLQESEASEVDLIMKEELSTPPAPVTPSPAGAGPMVGNCSVFPADNAWNQDISATKVHPNSAGYMDYIKNSGGNQFLHADFWGNGEYGIPYTIVSEGQKKVPISFTDYGDESDPGPYPIPDNAPIEWGATSDGDRHVLVVDQNACMLYELYNAHKTYDGWDASSAARYNLASNALRPDYWTSADAAGLPIFPGLARYDEASKNEIRHALRVTFSRTQKGFIHPATHYASSVTDPNAPPMGLRLRLKSNFDTSAYIGESRAILEALKKYGLIVADNGSNWFVTGSADTRWNDDILNQLKKVPGSAFEAVYTGEIVK